MVYNNCWLSLNILKLIGLKLMILLFSCFEATIKQGLNQPGMPRWLTHMTDSWCWLLTESSAGTFSGVYTWPLSIAWVSCSMIIWFQKMSQQWKFQKPQAEASNFWRSGIEAWNFHYCHLCHNQVTKSSIFRQKKDRFQSLIRGQGSITEVYTAKKLSLRTLSDTIICLSGQKHCN